MEIYWGATSYGMNPFFVGSASGANYYIAGESSDSLIADGLFPMTRTRRAGSTILMADSVAYRPSLMAPEEPIRGVACLSSSKHTEVTHVTYAIDDRHGDGANVAFVDGHVEKTIKAMYFYQGAAQEVSGIGVQPTTRKHKFFHPEYSK